MYSSYVKTFFSDHVLHALPSAQNFFSTASPRTKKFNSPFKTSFDTLLGPEKKLLAPHSVFSLHRRGDTALRPSYMSLLFFSLSSLFIHFFQLITTGLSSHSFPKTLGVRCMHVRVQSCVIIYTPLWGPGQHSVIRHIVSAVKYMNIHAKWDE